MPRKRYWKKRRVCQTEVSDKTGGSGLLKNTAQRQDMMPIDDWTRGSGLVKNTAQGLASTTINVTGGSGLLKNTAQRLDVSKVETSLSKIAEMHKEFEKDTHKESYKDTLPDTSMDILQKSLPNSMLPFGASRILFGSFHQNDSRFSEVSRGYQCTGNALAMLSYATSCNIQHSEILDMVLYNGDNIYKDIINDLKKQENFVNNLLSLDEVPSYISTDWGNFNVEKIQYYKRFAC